MSSSRQFSQPRSHCRSFAPRSRFACSAGARSPRGIPAATQNAAAAMRTASPMNCAAGAMPRAAQAAPIPDPTAAPMDHAACMLGIRVRPAARSTAAPSTLISTSSVPIPVPVTTKATAISGTERTTSERPMTVNAAAMSRTAPATARRLPSRCSRGVEASSPRMAPTVPPASSSPSVAVPTPRSALTAGSRGPQVEMVIPPSPNAAVITQRQRASSGRADDDDTSCLRTEKPSSGKYHGWAAGEMPRRGVGGT